MSSEDIRTRTKDNTKRRQSIFINDNDSSENEEFNKTVENLIECLDKSKSKEEEEEDKKLYKCECGRTVDNKFIRRINRYMELMENKMEIEFEIQQLLSDVPDIPEDENYANEN